VTDATLAILAGGEGRRMGGPKALLRVGGRPILAYLLDRFRWAGPTLLVTAPGRERPPGAELFGREVIDPTRGEGPLRGVLTALEAATTEVAVVTTCDMPRVDAQQLAWLADELSTRATSQILMLTRDGRIEPFPLAIRRATLPLLREHFDRGGRSMHSIVDIPGAVTVRAPAEWSDDVWTNVNTPDDLAAFDEGNPTS
jgi:molybdopterin-guanine dinucleotide biosynthesis protein A